MQRDFKGVWIPKEIWLNENLSHTEKFLLIEINSLENINGCYATNDHFSKLLGVTKDRISKLLTSLRRKGYITIEIIYKENTKEIEKRILKTQLQNEQEQQEPLGEDTYTPSSKHLYPLGEDTYTPIGENTYENNTVLEIQENNIITPLTPLGENKHQNPNQKPKKQPKEKPKDNTNKKDPQRPHTQKQETRQEPLPEPLEETFQEWLTYKAEKRQHYKPTGEKHLRKQIQNRLQNHSIEQIIQVIEYSIANNYQGIVFDKLTQKGAPNEQHPRPSQTSRPNGANESTPTLGTII